MRKNISNFATTLLHCYWLQYFTNLISWDFQSSHRIVQKHPVSCSAVGRTLELSVLQLDGPQQPKTTPVSPEQESGATVGTDLQKPGSWRWEKHQILKLLTCVCMFYALCSWYILGWVDSMLEILGTNTEPILNLTMFHILHIAGE